MVVTSIKFITVQSRLNHHYSTQIEWFRTYFNHTVDRKGMEDIHQLRVFIKRIRTVLSLTQIVSDEVFNKKPHFQLFSPLFQIAGVLREIHMNEALLHEVGSDTIPHYRNFLDNSKGSATADLLAEMEEFDFSALEILNVPLLEKMNALPNQKVAELTVAYLTGKLDKVASLINMLNDNQKVHKIRIHLQNIRAALRLMHDLNPSAEIEKIQRDTTLLTDLIGRWHDIAVFLEALDKYAASSDGEKVEDLLENVIDQFSKEKESIQVEIGDSLKRYLAEDRKKPLLTWAESPHFDTD